MHYVFLKLLHGLMDCTDLHVIRQMADNSVIMDNRNRYLNISRAPLESQAQGISLFSSA